MQLRLITANRQHSQGAKVLPLLLQILISATLIREHGPSPSDGSSRVSGSSNWNEKSNQLRDRNLRAESTSSMAPCRGSQEKWDRGWIWSYDLLLCSECFFHPWDKELVIALKHPKPPLCKGKIPAVPFFFSHHPSPPSMAVKIKVVGRYESPPKRFRGFNVLNGYEWLKVRNQGMS